MSFIPKNRYIQIKKSQTSEQVDEWVSPFASKTEETVISKYEIVAVSAGCEQYTSSDIGKLVLVQTGMIEEFEADNILVVSENHTLGIMV